MSSLLPTTRALAAAALLLTGCAGAAPSRDLDGAFRRIQRAEARADDGYALASSAGAHCPERCDGAAAICAAAADACEVAHEIEDADALTRCARLERMCRAGPPACAPCRCPRAHPPHEARAR